MSDFPFFNRNISIKVMQNEFFLVMSVFLSRTFFQLQLRHGRRIRIRIWQNNLDPDGFCSQLLFTS